MLTKVSTFRLRSSLVLAFSGLALSACGGSQEGDSLQPPPQINSATVFSGSLTQSNAINVERFIKNGVYANSLAQSEPVTASSPVAPTNSDASGGSFSGTNTIEQGVDEADRVKYDGTYMYLAETFSNVLREDGKHSIRVLQRNEDYTLSSLPSLQSSLDFSEISDMYLYQDMLAIVGNNNSSYYYLDTANSTSFDRGGNKLSLSFFDVSEPASGQELTSLQIDGTLANTRRIGDDLYIISTYYSSIDNLQNNATTDEEKQANYTTVIQTPIVQLMPKIYKDGQESLLNEPENCYIPSQASNIDGNIEFVHVTKISLVDPNNIESLCLSAYSGSIYMSTDSLYLVASDYMEKTVFHKIDLASFDYVASGAVDGLFGWRDNPAFRMDEANGQLRIVTTNYNQSPMVHSLHILAQDGNELKTIARLPNEQAPEAIGKPGEDVYAVRFIDEKAYIVTFERLDPLYVINLSDGSNPFIEGSLEIPGFSSYIHPLDNNFLLGIGQQISPQQFIEPQPDVISAPVLEGMKVSLFDVRDPSNPIELSSLVTPNAYTPVEYEYKALSVLNTNGNYQFALPFQTWSQVNESGNLMSSIMLAYSREALMLLEVNTNDAEPSLDLMKNMFAPDPSDWFHYTPTNRSIIQGNKVYFIRGNEVYLGDWVDADEDSSVLGPF